MASVEEKARRGYATIPEVREYLRVSRAHVYSLMDRGELAYAKFGNCRRIAWTEVERYVAESTIGG